MFPYVQFLTVVLLFFHVLSGLWVHSISEPALDCWILLISQGWGTNVYDGSKVWFVVLYGVIQFLRRLADPVLMFKFHRMICQFDHEQDFNKRTQEAHEIAFLMQARDDLAYVDFLLCLFYWCAVLYSAVQTYKLLKSSIEWNEIYYRFLYVLAILAGTDQAAYMIEVLFMDAGWVSYRNFLIMLEVIELTQLGLLGVIGWLWRPSEGGDLYAQVAIDDPSFQYLELQEGVAQSTSPPEPAGRIFFTDPSPAFRAPPPQPQQPATVARSNPPTAVPNGSDDLKAKLVTLLTAEEDALL